MGTQTSCTRNWNLQDRDRLVRECLDAAAMPTVLVAMVLDYDRCPMGSMSSQSSQARRLRSEHKIDHFRAMDITYSRSIEQWIVLGRDRGGHAKQWSSGLVFFDNSLKQTRRIPFRDVGDSQKIVELKTMPGHPGCFILIQMKMGPAAWFHLNCGQLRVCAVEDANEVKESLVQSNFAGEKGSHGKMECVEFVDEGKTAIHLKGTPSFTPVWTIRATVFDRDGHSTVALVYVHDSYEPYSRVVLFR